MNCDFDINNFTRVINPAFIPVDDQGGLDQKAMIPFVRATSFGVIRI